MLPLEGNGVWLFRQGSLESWHQVIPQPPRPTQNPDRYKWDDIKDQVQMVSVSRSNRSDDSKPGTSKPKRKRVRLRGNIKLKRLVKTKAGGKRFRRTVTVVNIGRKWRLKLGKSATPATTPLQNTKKKFKKAIKSASESHK